MKLDTAPGKTVDYQRRAENGLPVSQTNRHYKDDESRLARGLIRRLFSLIDGLNLSLEKGGEMSTVTTLELGERLALLPWIRWGAGHLGELDDVIAAVGEWSAVPAVPIRPKWESSKVVGDSIVGVIEDAPPFVQALTTEPTVESLQVEEARFDGTLLKRFLESLPEIIAVVTQLAGLFGKS